MLIALPPKPLELDPRPTDVIVATYRKCGTTWMLQIAHQLRTCGSMDFDDICDVVPWLEVCNQMGRPVDVEQVANPRVFKSHLPWEALPKGGKFICVLRDPGDALVSLYHFFNGAAVPLDSMDLDRFAELLFLTPDVSHGYYWNHIRSFLSRRDDPNVMLCCYEDMKRDLIGVVRRVAAFMGFPDDEERIAITVEHASFEFMKEHKTKFDERVPALALRMLRGLSVDGWRDKVRSGRTGDALTTLSSGLRTRLDEIWRREIFDPLGIPSYEKLCEQLSGDPDTGEPDATSDPAAPPEVTSG